MSLCQYTRGPPLNTDISGIGVRISFYFQTLFLGFLSARSGTIHEISGALYTLMATNAAMGITALILGLKPVPDISLQDALIILYLLSMSWIVVITSFASCSRLSDDTKVLQLASVIQSYVTLAFAFTVLATAPNFGTSSECNQNTLAVIFRPFSALKTGRILGWILFSLAFIVYTAMTARDYTTQVLNRIRKKKEPHPGSEVPPIPDQQPPVDTSSPYNFIRAKQRETPRRQSTSQEQPSRNVDGQLLFTLGLILTTWSFFVLNTELVIRWNQSPGQNGASSWQFGQILPMFLILLPFVNMISAFSQFGMKPTKQIQREQLVKISVIYDREFDLSN